jgi:hypothetical protein
MAKAKNIPVTVRVRRSTKTGKVACLVVTPRNGSAPMERHLGKSRAKTLIQELLRCL